MLFTPNLLVTDDDSAFRQVVSEGLARRGFCVLQASDGQEAIDVIDSSEVHLALIDVHMPRVTGLEVIQHVNSRPDRPSLRRPACVLMSAELNEDIRREAERMRAYQVLSKPLRLAELMGIVSGALAEVYGWRPPAT